MAESLYPPHSRLYVNCDRDTTDEELLAAFRPYGTVVDVKLCKDAKTGQKKGFAFVQFEKTSEAAAAMEGLTGTTVGQSRRPIKITVALPKDQNSNDPTQFLRLFLCVPKTSTEDDLQNEFSRFGEIDAISIVRNRETKESKGFAFIKFKRFMDAAHAYENCDQSYRVVFAKPKDQTNSRFLVEGPNAGGSNDFAAGACTHIDDNPEGYSGLRAIVSADLTDDQIEWLFDIPPGLDHVRFFNEPPMLGFDGFYSRKVLVQYDSPGTAAYALRKLNNFEFPVDEKIQLQPNYDINDRMAQFNRKAGVTNKAMARPGQASDLMKQVENLTRTLNEAMQLLEQNGLGGHIKPKMNEIEAFRCSTILPPPKPLAPPNCQTAERLFLVCEPGLPPQDALWDVFGRFGNLIELYILNGKNCGYARYSEKFSARTAMQTLNDQYLYRMKMRVMIAEPAKDDRKRHREDY